MNTLRWTQPQQKLSRRQREAAQGYQVLFRSPTNKEVITILRAVHKYKDSREQFEMRTHKRLIDVIRPTAKTTDALQKLEIPAGVDIVMELK